MDVAHLVAAVTRLARFLLRDRMVHFAAMGLALFALAPRSGPAGTRVSLSSAYLGALRAAQAQRLGVPRLSGDVTAEVDRRAIEDEVLYREALRLDLDRDDALVREHLIQKMLILAEDLAGASREPTRADLEAYFERTRERWRLAETVHLIHVFAAKRETLVQLAGAVAAAAAARPGAPPPLGDAFPRSRDVRGARDDLAATYGDELADAVMQLPTERWSAPIRSRFGWHLVEVVEHTAGRPAAFAEVEGRVRLAYAVERRHEAIARYLARAFARYQVDIDGVRVSGYRPTQRLAVRSQASAED